MLFSLIFLSVLLPVIDGFQFRSFGRVDKTVTGRLIPVCEYNGLDILDGSYFTTAACMTCICKRGHLSCRGYGVNAGESIAPPGCVVIADGCEAVHVKQSNKSLDCLTGKPIETAKTNPGIPPNLSEMFPDFLGSARSTGGIPIDMNMLRIYNAAATATPNMQGLGITGTGSGSAPLSSILLKPTASPGSESLQGPSHLLPQNRVTGLGDLSNTLGSGLQAGTGNSLNHDTVHMFDQLLGNSTDPLVWDILLNELLSGYTNRPSTTLDAIIGSMQPNPTPLVNTRLSGGPLNNNAMATAQQNNQTPNSLLSNIILYKGLTELRKR